MRKHVIYKGEEYEVRWEQMSGVPYVTLYKVKKIFKIKQYKYVYGEMEIILDDLYDIDSSNINYRINQAEAIVCKYDKIMENNIKKNKLEFEQAVMLSGWDGVAK